MTTPYTQRLNLEVNVRLYSVDERGYSVGGGLELRENVTLSVAGFLEAAKVLGQFHDLAQAVKKEESR